MTLWLDVEDLFHYAVHNPRPSGIQRLSFEIYVELYSLLGDEVRFCRHDPLANTLRVVPWETLRSLFTGLLVSALRTEPPATPDVVPLAPQPGRLRLLARSLPLAMRHPIAQALAAQRQALAAQWSVLRYGQAAIRALPSLFQTASDTASSQPGAGAAPGRDETGAESAPLAGEDMRDLARPGDVFCVLGSPWFHLDYVNFVSGVIDGRGLRVALLVYDIIPIMRPEWCDRGLIRVFSKWFSDFIPQAHKVFAISEATARDVERWAAQTDIQVSLPVYTLPIGTGFSGPPVESAESLPAGLQAGSYVLFVSTIEARKNHLLAFRVWRRMVEEMPPESVPTLVLAGRFGWLMSDFLQQLINCDYLDKKIVVVSDPSDAELVALYRNCRFTLFPSLYEGWGLPVTESLSFGKVCVASDRTSVPEAGGPFCIYLDPEDFSSAVGIIRNACMDDSLISSYEDRIRREFRPTPWRHTAEALLRHLSD